MNSSMKTTEPDLFIPPHTISQEQEKLITMALQTERKRREEKSTKE
jgi:hypothetical protein